MALTGTCQIRHCGWQFPGISWWGTQPGPSCLDSAWEMPVQMPLGGEREKQKKKVMGEKNAYDTVGKQKLKDFFFDNKTQKA